MQKISTLFFILLTGCSNVEFKDLDISKISLENSIIKNNSIEKIRVYLFSKFDLWKLAKSESLVLGVSSFLCKYPNDNFLIHDNSIFSGNYDINKLYIDMPSPLVKEKSGKYLYSILLDVNSNFSLGVSNEIYTKGSNVTFRSHDLRKTPEDICFKVWLKSMFPSYSSNEFILKGSDIKHLLDNNLTEYKIR